MTSKNTEVSIEQLEKEAPQVVLENSRLLFLDVSSSCTGYCIFETDFSKKKAAAVSAGAIWFPESSNQEKYHYIYSAVTNYFNIVERIDYIVAEQYSINRDKMMGVMVSIEMHGALKTAAEEIGCKVRTFPPQSWRSEMKIKKNASGDWKEPTKQAILTYTDIPETITSNITHNTRKTPSDLYDAIALGLGFLKRLGFSNFDFKQLELQKHVGVLDV